VSHHPSWNRFFFPVKHARMHGIDFLPPFVMGHSHCAALRCRDAHTDRHALAPSRTHPNIQMPSSTVLARICKHSHHTQNNYHTSSSCLLGVGPPPSPTWRQHNRTFSTQKGGGWNVKSSGKEGRDKRGEDERQNSLEDSRLERAQVFEPAFVFCACALRAFTQMHAKSGWRCVTIREICVCNKTGCLHRSSKVFRDPIQVRG